MKRRPRLARDLRWSRALAALAIAVAAGGVPLSQADASCAAPPELGEHLNGAEIVFVGVVTGVGNHARTAVFLVAEQWKGDRLGSEVVVHGGQDDPNAFSSGDRTYELGVRYLVAADVRGGRLEDNSCSATQTWSADLAGFRPVGALILDDPISETPAPNAGIPWEVVVIGGASAVLALVAALAFLRQPRQDGVP